MLQIKIPAMEYFDEVENEFLYKKEVDLALEHSLVSISKWESKWNKPFLGKQDKTPEEIFDYIKCMTLTQNVPDEVYNRLTKHNIEEIKNYIDSPMTATTFREDRNGHRNGEIITSELIYYWMVALQIPFECQKWHLNRLLTLIRVCNIKNQPGKKMSPKQTMAQNAALNKARRAQHHSTG